MAMQRELKDKWVAALRSDKFVQGHGSLERMDREDGTPRNCCLGVLCRVAGIAEYTQYDELDQVFFGTKRSSSECYLTPTVLKQVGLTPNAQSFLALVNDGEAGIMPASTRKQMNPDSEQWNFAQIANWIENNVRVKESV